MEVKPATNKTINMQYYFLKVINKLYY